MSGSRNRFACLQQYTMGTRNVLSASAGPSTRLVKFACLFGSSNVKFTIKSTHADDKTAAPYEFKQLHAAREALAQLDDVAPKYLEDFEERNAEFLALLYPYEPKHLLLRHKLEELFDTTPDLSGADIDISRFIRSGDERDVLVFWEDILEATPPQSLRASRDALCAVPFHKKSSRMVVWTGDGQQQGSAPQARDVRMGVGLP